MSEMVERVGIAIHAKLPGIEFSHEMFLILAHAAIEAIREPTEAMVEAGQSTRCPWHEEIRLIWPQMIDEALK